MGNATRKIDHILQRPGSRNWVVRLQLPGGKAKEASLGTPDYREAVVRAGPMITAHRAALLAARPRIEMAWRHKLEPGRKHAGPDAGEIIATDRELIYVGHNGAVLRQEPNGGLVMAIANLENRLGLTKPVFQGGMVSIETSGERPTVATKTADDAILETYLKHANVTGYFEREARATWALYKTVTDGKPLKDAKRDDGRKLAAVYEAEGLKSATIQKKIMWLSAAVNLAIKDDKLKFNPFTGVVGKSDDSATRLPLNDAEIKECKRHLGKLGKSDQLLFRLLASTGMRLREAFEVDGEEPKERGHRFIIVGKKTKQSERRVPLPAAMLPHLPVTIKGKLFEGTSAAASKRLMKFLRREVGIADPLKVAHSLRHRAQDRLRAAGCPEDMRWAILGHEEETVAAGYGEGFPVTMLKKWIDRIGF